MEPEDMPYSLTITRLMTTDYRTGLERLQSRFPRELHLLDHDYRTRQFLPDELCIQASRRERVLGCRLLVPHRPFRIQELKHWFIEENLRPAIAEELVAFVLAYVLKRRGEEYGDTFPWIAIGSTAQYGDNLVVPMWRDKEGPKLQLVQLNSVSESTYGFLGVHITKRSF